MLGKNGWFVTSILKQVMRTYNRGGKLQPILPFLPAPGASVRALSQYLLILTNELHGGESFVKS
jgi:hypothetical protein